MKILYICPDLGIPVLGRKGAAVHVRELVAAFRRAGHSVVLATPLLNKSPWEEPARFESSLLHMPPSPEVIEAVLALKRFNETLGIENSLPGELRRILHDQEWGVRLKRKFDNHRPHFIYERVSLYSTVGVFLARELDRPLIIELNSPQALEQTTYRATGLGELAAQSERWTLSRADAVLTVSAALRDYAVSLGVDPDRVHVLPNGVNAELFRPESPEPEVNERWGLGDSLVLGFVGGLRPWHGVEVLPALLDRLVRRHPALRDGDRGRRALAKPAGARCEGTRADGECRVHGLATARGGCGPDPSVRRGPRSLSSSRPRLLLLPPQALRVHGLRGPGGGGGPGTDRGGGAGRRDGPALSPGRTGSVDHSVRPTVDRSGPAPPSGRCGRERSTGPIHVGPKRPARARTGEFAPRGTRDGRMKRTVNIPVVDPFCAADDPELPSIATALDPDEAQRQFDHRLGHLAGGDGSLQLREIRVARYKPGRRCVIEYDLEQPEAMTLLGKVRVRRFGKSGYRLLSAFWNSGFDADAPDGIAVPEPVGTVSKFRMWLQRKVPGQAATDLLAAGDVDRRAGSRRQRTRSTGRACPPSAATRWPTSCVSCTSVCQP